MCLPSASFFQHAVDLGHLTVTAHSDAFGSHRFRTETGAREQRDAWTSEELVKLFGSPVWAGHDPSYRIRPGSLITRDAKFWLPLLALYHGGRLEEFADLYRKDIICEGGVWAMRITPSLVAGEDEGDEPRERRLKTKNSKRTVPVHTELIRMGFVRYVKATAPLPRDPVFPDVLPQGAGGKRGPRVTRWFAEYRKAVDVYRVGVGMHAFRHVAITRLRNVITDWQQERHLNYVMGHATDTGEGGGRYDKGPGLKAVAATLALLRYPELDLSHLYEADGSR